MAFFSLAFGSATKNRDGKIIEAFFPHPRLNPSDDLIEALTKVVGYEQGNQAIEVSAQQSHELAKVFAEHDDAELANFAQQADDGRINLGSIQQEANAIANGSTVKVYFTGQVTSPVGTVTVFNTDAVNTEGKRLILNLQ